MYILDNMVRTYIKTSIIRHYYIDNIKTMDQSELHAFEAWCLKQYPDSLLMRELLEHYIHGVYNGFTHDHPHLDIKEMRLLTKLHSKWKNGNDAVWITISPDHIHNHFEYNKLNLQRVDKFCRKWFDPKRYSYYSYVIEVGSNPDKPHLHVHALVQFTHKSVAKNHARELRTYWHNTTLNKLGPKDYLSKNISGTYVNDKLDYMKQSAKGSHENFVQDPFEHLGLQGYYLGTKGELI